MFIDPQVFRVWMASPKVPPLTMFARSLLAAARPSLPGLLQQARGAMPPESITECDRTGSLYCAQIALDGPS
jgi:hypothetical protein